MKSLAFAAALAVLAAHAASAQELERVIDRGDFVFSNSWRPPPDSAPW
jgi:opacity protein-like surface antigen